MFCIPDFTSLPIDWRRGTTQRKRAFPPLGFLVGAEMGLFDETERLAARREKGRRLEEVSKKRPGFLRGGFDGRKAQQWW